MAVMAVDFFIQKLVEYQFIFLIADHPSRSSLVCMLYRPIFKRLNSGFTVLVCYYRPIDTKSVERNSAVIWKVA